MKNKITGSYEIHVGNYDWGCSVDYAILTLDQPISHKYLKDLSKWKVKERKMIPDQSTKDYELIEKVFDRGIQTIYHCDEKGKKDPDTLDRLCIKLKVSPVEGSPLVYTSQTQIFIWSDPYELHFSYEGEEYELCIDPIYKKKRTSVDMFKKKTYTSKDGIVYDYAEYIPENDNGTLYVWLHGLGEGQFEGSDAYLPLLGRKGKSMAGSKFQNAIGGARVLVPQCPTYWMDGDGKQSNFYDQTIKADATSFYTKSLEEFIDAYAEEMQAKRIVLAGCSNGGYMCLVLAISRPDRYSAIVPICEAVPDDMLNDEMIKKLAKVPAYFVYSKDDPIVLPESHEIPTIERLRKAGAKNLHVSETEEVVDTSGVYKNEDGTPYRYMGHLSWIYYDNNETDDGDGLSAWEWLGKTIF